MEAKIEKVKNVLVPTDLSEVCEKALYQAVEVVKEQNGSIHLLHIIEDEKNSAEVDQKLEAFAKKTDYTNITLIKRKGDIYKTINEVAEELDVDLIIMATHGKKGVQKIFGSFALKVIDSTEIPVLVVQSKVVENGFRNILFPVSLLDEDRQKTAIAIKLAKMFDSKIHIYPRFESSKVGEKQMINTILQIKSYLNKYDIQYEVAPLETNTDNFQKKILNYSKEINADLILIISDSSNHLPILGGKEETLLFNELEIPVMCIEDKKSKKARFSVTG
ncbi:MAG: universal stress protein [Bacteroidales bacterium]|nr:universal stress protein [Bacteroidales bacterium]